MTYEALEQELRKLLAEKAFSGHVAVAYEARLSAELDHIRAQAPASLEAIAEAVRLKKAPTKHLLFSFLLGLHDKDPLVLSIPISYKGELDAPDVDVDFSDNSTAETALSEILGASKVFHVATFSTRNVKGTIRDVCRVFDVQPTIAAKLTEPFSDFTTIAEAKKIVTELGRHHLWHQHSDLWPVVERLIGLVRHVGQHSAGRVYLPSGMTDLPLIRLADSDVVAVGISEGTSSRFLGELGYVKFDFLGLETLRLLDEVATKTGTKDALKGAKLLEEMLVDKKLFEAFGSGETEHIFQFGSSGMKDVLRAVKPANLEDLSACAALYRPGSKDFIPEYVQGKEDPSSISWLRPELKKILGVTHGVIVYQEQIAQVFVELGGFSPKEAEGVRKILKIITSANPTKDWLEKWEKTKQKFLSGCAFEESTALAALEIIKKYAGYTFNKSHSLSYALLALQTMYYKVHHSLEFWTAVVKGAEAKKAKGERGIAIRSVPESIPILPPHFLLSDVAAKHDGENIRLGLGSVSGVQSNDLLALLEWRTANAGQVKPLRDIQVEVLNLVSKKTADALAFSNSLSNRQTSFEEILELLAESKHYKASTKAGRERLAKLEPKTALQRDLLYLETLIWENPFRKLRGTGLWTLPSDLPAEDDFWPIKTLALVFSKTKRTISTGPNKGKVFYILDVGDDVCSMEVALFDIDIPPEAGTFVKLAISRRNGRTSARWAG